eukprot:242399_1
MSRTFQMILTSILFVVLLNNVKANYEIILAAYDAYFSAKALELDTPSTLSTIFNAPKSGTITGIILSHLSGGVSCKGCCCNDNLGYKNLTYWGCKGSPDATSVLNVMLMKITDESTYYGQVLYPALSTKGVTIAKYYPEYDYRSCDRGCHIQWTGSYYMNGYTAFSTNLTFIDPSYNVTTQDKFALEYAPACCSEFIPINNHPTGIAYDNCGSGYAKVYFLYMQPTQTPFITLSNAPTKHPSLAPSIPLTHQNTTNGVKGTIVIVVLIICCTGILTVLAIWYYKCKKRVYLHRVQSEDDHELDDTIQYIKMTDAEFMVAK